LHLLEVLCGAAGRDAGRRVTDERAAGQVTRGVVRLVKLPGMNLHVAHRRPELPRRTGRERADELDANRAIDIDVLGHLLRLARRPAAEAGDLAEHVVERHEREAEAEHADAERRELEREYSILTHRPSLRRSL